MKQTAESPQLKTWIDDYSDLEFSGISSNEWYGVAGNEAAAKAREEAKQAFLADESIRYPDVEYPNLDDLSFTPNEQEYWALLERAIGMDDDQADILYEMAARKLAELYRHKEVARRVGGISVSAELSKERAALMAIEIFNEPRTEYYGRILSGLRRKVDGLKGEKIADELSDQLGDQLPESKAAGFEIEDKTIETLRSDILDIFPTLKDVLVDEAGSDVSPEDSITHFQSMLDALGMSEQGWVAELTSGAAASTSGDKKVVGIGKRRKAFTAKSLNAVMIHECIGHGWRAFMASQQEGVKNRALPESLAFEEGLATGLEQIMGGERRIAGEQYYLNIGLQLGLDNGGQRRDFRDVFEIIWRKIALEDIEKGKEPNIEDAKDKAYQQCLRTTRGGALDTRDISYFDGASKAYQWLNELAAIDDKEERHKRLKWVLSGRFDPTNSSHQTVFPYQ